MTEINKLKIYPLPAFRDNYIWIIHTTVHAVIVDPGDAAPVIDYLESHHLQPIAILITHHHSDHTGGNLQLLERYNLPVYGPLQEKIPTVTHPVREGDRIQLTPLALTFDVLEIPGHTRGHIAYFTATQLRNMLFCGDTLFACGCGRIFEGTPQQMYDSLQKLASLPDDTLVYCTHEYTLGNISFARVAEPGNDELRKLEQQAKKMRQQHLPTLPTDMATEKACNPFLRCQHLEIIHAAEQFTGEKLIDPVEVFTALRKWKNVF
ncbi:MAG: hydroxyacylglutathione hydrolase [Nitrosomonas sp.]|nr:hydroxyacylglutathione hydrolase [Nitrosomonas sp.]MCW5608210.1 hydroxyacylglutathione hydrolase [Nitrosomonas sp.]